MNTQQREDSKPQEIKPSWISVDDDLPEYNHAVIWYKKNGTMIIAAVGSDDYPLDKAIMAWHELPSRPKIYRGKIV